MKLKFFYFDETIKNIKKLLKAVKLNSCKEAQQNDIYPYGTYCILCNGDISIYKHATKKELERLLERANK